MSTYVNIIPAIPTFAAFATLAGGGFTMDVNQTHEISFKQDSGIYEIWKPGNSGNAQTQYKVSDENIESIQRIETIHKFASNLLENIEDLDPEFSKVIDENYWDLI